VTGVTVDDDANGNVSASGSDGDEATAESEADD